LGFPRRTSSNWQRLAGLVNSMGAHLPKPYHANIEDAYQQATTQEVEARVPANDEEEINS